MATARRDRNKNFFRWEPVEADNNRFTRNAPVNWFYEINDTTELLPCEEDESTENISIKSQEDILAGREISRMTPTNDELLKAAKAFPPPPEWFEEDEERPF